MARKVTFNTSDTLTTYQQKLNQMSDYIGDLDSIKHAVKFGAPNYYKTDGIQDSAQDGFRFNQSPASMNIINGLNLIESGFNHVHEIFSDSNGIMKVGHLSADSAVFNIVHTGSLITDSDFLILDSATFNKVVGVTLDFDSAQFDSARIDFVSGSFLNYDSGFGLVNTGPTAGVPVTWPGRGDFNILRFDSGLTADSGIFTNLSGNTMNFDSSSLLKVSIDSVGLPNNTNMDVIVLESATFNQLTFDAINITDLKKLVLTGRSPLDSSTSAAVGSIVLAGHLVSTNNDSGIV